MKARFLNRFCGRARLRKRHASRPPGLRRAETCPVKLGEATATQAGAPLFSRVCNGIGRARRSRPTNNRATAAFSLVEVALAVAVIAIGLLVILGLFPQGLQSARDAADNTLSATIAQDLFSQLRSSSFTNVTNCNQTSCTVFGLHTNGTYRFDFDHDGFITNAASYYQVILRCLPQSPLVLSLVQATVVWPAHVSSAPINTNIFMTEIAWYDNP